MAFLEVKIDLSRIAKALERIAASVEYRMGKPPNPKNLTAKPKGVDDMVTFDPELECLREDEEESLREQGRLSRQE